MALFAKIDEKPTPLGSRNEEEITVTTPTRTGDVHTLIGKGSEFEGKLTFEGQVRIDGKFSGQISTKDTLVVGEGARVNAEISAGTVVVHGTIDGNIKATQMIEIHQPGRVKGNLDTPALSIDKGVIFEGSCKMEGSPSASTSKSTSISAVPPVAIGQK